MATQICPECKANAFTWYIDDEPEVTHWICSSCSYHALEDEKDECICNDCGKKTKTKLKDPSKEYWWCSSCNRISDNK
ncbi:hypothetical protein H5J24_12910 [Chryseobacterium capnotolerans]|uniref:hypothetical protein n=1 Tax=Chryseobacterium TaxID=59732 RepID=UPI00083A2F66|nr:MULTISPECIES: hypothetical protein [Chryseobacterium]UHO36729.1 hypothetical protein H5J24_12910 [Chryseobacterium capnotolerans]